jgi:hypothetical protein
MIHINKGTLAAYYQIEAKADTPEPIDPTSQDSRTRCAIQLCKKERLETVDLAAMRRAINRFVTEQGVEIEQYFSGLIKND